MGRVAHPAALTWTNSLTAKAYGQSIHRSLGAYERSRLFSSYCSLGSSYHPSDFTGAGFTSTVETGGPTAGPIGKAGPMLGRGVNPKALKQFLDTYVIGQSRPKRVLSVAVYNHYQRAQSLLRRQEEEEELAREARLRHTHPVEDEFPGQQTTVHYQGNRPASSILESVASSQIDIQKSNVLMIGPSGVGKTLMCRTLARILDVPFSISDCTAFTQAGYVGEDADVCVQRLLSAANWDVKKAEMGIICLDEVDKIATAKMMSTGRDVSGEGVQQALLKILEGTTLQISSKNERPRQSSGGLPNNAGSSFNTSGHPSPFQPFGGGSNMGTGQGGFGATSAGGKGETYTIDTSNILFILCGAFNGLNKTIMDRISRHSIGFNAPVRTKAGNTSNLSPEAEAQLLKEHRPYFSRVEDNVVASSTLKGPQSPDRKSRFNALELVEPRDLTSFGLIPEFVGRVPIIASLEALDEEMLVRVLLEPRNSLVKQYEHLFEMSGVELKFTSPALREVARTALSMETGARGLRTVLERLLTDAMFESPSSTTIKHVLITEAVAKLKQPPIYFARGQKDRFHSMIAAEEADWNKRQGEVEGQDHDRPGSFEAYREKEKAAGFV